MNAQLLISMHIFFNRKYRNEENMELLWEIMTNQWVVSRRWAPSREISWGSIFSPGFLTLMEPLTSIAKFILDF
jgi:hypothetical protein